MRNKKSIRFFNNREVRAVWDDGISRQQMLCAPSMMKMTTQKAATIGNT